MLHRPAGAAVSPTGGLLQCMAYEYGSRCCALSGLRWGVTCRDGVAGQSRLDPHLAVFVFFV